VIRQGYGLTELTAIGTVTVFGEEKFGSVGKVFSGTLCKIRHPASGMALGPNQVGEICFKGPTVMKGYCGNDEATRNTITPSGWLLTGDIGYYDEKQCFYLVGRLKELIKYKGFQVKATFLCSVCCESLWLLGSTGRARSNTFDRSKNQGRCCCWIS
jgi:4-coumarate--CoA ligase